MMGELLGQTLGGRYRFEELIGEGSFARVYRITDLHRRATLAAKVLRRDIAQDESFLERFRREAVVLARLQHPHIVRYYDIVELADLLFILMDYIPGTTLEHRLSELDDTIRPYSSLTYLTPLASALHFAHNEGIIHRDLKPANILLHENGTVYVTDFGIARILNTASELTLGVSIGTPFYMAPEQITGDPVTVATDIYALGIILYRMYTGRVPFRGDYSDTNGESTAARITYEHVYQPPQPPVELNPSLGLPVQEIILRCLQKDPSRRYAAVSDLLDALTEAVGAAPVALIPPDIHSDSSSDARPSDMKLPEWSQFIAQVDEEAVEDAPPPTQNRIEHPVPLPPTEPHLEQALRSASPAARTLQAASQLPQQAAAVVPPAYFPPPVAPPPPPARRRRWPVISALAGALIVAGVCCAAAVYLLTYSDENGERNRGSDSPPPPLTESDTDTERDTGALSTAPPTLAPTRLPGGSRIAFDSERGGTLDIYVMNIDGSDFRQITGSSGAERGPAWSPDGEQIAFYGAATENGNYDIYIINQDGTDLRNLTGSADIDDKYPTWSPDGTQLAFHSNADGDYDLYIINADGSGLRAVTNNDDDDLGPDWSPEGTQLAYHTSAWGTPYEVAVLNLSTNEVRRMTDSDDTNAFPTWSPDGTRLAYHAISALNGTLNIFVLNIDTGATQQITTGMRNAFPDWSPDGTQLVYQSGQPEISAIYMISVTGGTPQALTGTQSNFLPEWEPPR